MQNCAHTYKKKIDITANNNKKKKRKGGIKKIKTHCQFAITTKLTGNKRLLNEQT